MKECWIPDLVRCRNLSEWAAYDELLYRIFKSELIESRPVYRGLPVQIRYEPRFDGREEAYWHLTCKDYDNKSGLPEDRQPDVERCERIRWPKAFIEQNQECTSCSYPNGCNGAIIWASTHKSRHQNRKRVKILVEEERYMVVLESRERYWLLITAFYFQDDRKLMRTLNEAQKKGAVKAGSAISALPEGSFHTR